MILDRLILKNFKRFRNEEIQFKDGITGILGNNGTGKSSFVQAIFFALYGVQATGITADYIVSSFAGPKEKCEVRLDFRIGGETYQVVRTFKKGKTVSHDATFHQNGNLMATGVSPVEEAVKRTLGMGPVDFKNTIYAGQKDLLTLLENTPGKRKEWFLRALGIDYLNAGSQKILKEQIETMTGTLQKMTGQLEALAGRQNEEELTLLEQSVVACTAAIAEHEKTRATLETQRAELDRQQKILAEKKTAHARLQQQVMTLRQELSLESARHAHLSNSILLIAEEEAEYHRIEKTAGSYAEVRARLDLLQKTKAEHTRLNGELGFAKRETEELAARRERQQALIAGLTEDAQEQARLIATVRAGLGAGPEIPDDWLEGAFSYRLNDIMKMIGTLAARQEQYKEEREKLGHDQETIRNAGADGVCPLCRQKLGTHFSSLDAEFSLKVQELADKAVADLEKQERLEKERAQVESLKPALDAIRTLAVRLKQRAGWEAELAELAAKHDKKVQDQQALAGAIAELAFNDVAYSTLEREADTVQKVQARYAELGKRIG